MVAGDVMNTAARLQSAAPVDGILVGEQTYRATEREIVYREAEPVQAKGKAQPVPVWEAVEPRARLGSRPRRHRRRGARRPRRRARPARRRASPLAARPLDAARHARRRPGDRQEPPRVRARPGGRRGRGADHLAPGPLPAVRRRRLVLGARRDREGARRDPRVGSRRRDRVEARRACSRRSRTRASGHGSSVTCARWSVSAASRRAATSAARRSPPGGASSRRSPRAARWCSSSRISTGPTTACSTSSTGSSTGSTACRSSSSAPPGPSCWNAAPGWGGGKRNATTVSLAALDDDATARLVLSLLERPVLDAETQQALVERAAGNPLYAEEFVRMLQAGAGSTSGFPDRCRGSSRRASTSFPRAEKDLLQTAAVHGKVFWSDALASAVGIEPWRLSELLRSLERKEFVRREHRSAVAGATQHAFVHALVRDAAYNQLPRSARAERHLAAAEWIESLPDDRAEDRAETLAHHYLTAIELRRAAGEDVIALGPRAVRALQDAGERALALGAYDAATSFLESALELLARRRRAVCRAALPRGTGAGLRGTARRPPRAGGRRVRARGRPGAGRRGGRRRRAGTRGTRARPRHADCSTARRPSSTDGRRPARRRSSSPSTRGCSMMNFQFDSGRREAERAIEHARAIGDVELEADAIVTKAACMAKDGDSSAIELFDRALELVGHGRVAARAYTNLGVAWAALGDLGRAIEVSIEGAARAAQDGDVQGAAFLRGNVLGLRFDAGDWEEALQEANSLIGTPASTARSTWRSSFARPFSSRAATWPLRESTSSSPSSLPANPPKPRPCCRRSSGSRGSSAAAAGATTQRPRSTRSSPRWMRQSPSATSRSSMSSSSSSCCEAGRPQAAESIVERMPEGPWRDACRALSTATTRGRQTRSRRWGRSGSRPSFASGRHGRWPRRAGWARPRRSSSSRARFYRKVGATAFLAEADAIVAAAS